MWKELKWEDISKLKNSYDENGKLDLARSNDPYLFGSVPKVGVATVLRKG